MRRRCFEVSDSVLERICKLLSERHIAYKRIDHEPTFTSEESARVRREPLYVGAKALVVKTDDVFRLFVLPADKQLVTKQVKQELNVRSVRFATKEELLELTNLVPGSVPPFGEPIMPFELVADSGIGTNQDKVAFNAGSLTTSIVMKATDWRAVAKPKEFAFAKRSEI
jgi:prolyl-tRNA editing enzyme YbaK/EbsC (Cys-tRNA(Pro) deacylase)